MNHNFNVIRRHSKPLLALNLVCLMATLLSVTVLADYFSPPVWKAKAKFNVPNSGGNLNADLGTLGTIKDSSTGFSQELNPLEIQSTIITSDAVVNEVWQNDPEKESFPALKVFKTLFTVEPQPQSTVISLEAEGSSSELALARANNLVEVFQQRLNELRYSDADSRKGFVKGELKQAKDDLLKAQQELAEFRGLTGIVDSDTQTQQLVSSINELKTQLTVIQSEAEAGQTRAEIAANYFKTTPEKAVQSLNLAENQEYQEARQKLAQTEIELSDARSNFKDSSPQVQNLLFKREQLIQELEGKISQILPGVSRQEIDATLGNNGSTKRLDIIAESLTSQTASLGQQQQTVQIQNQIDKLTNELDDISVNKSKLIELERKHNIAEGVYKGIIAQTSRAKIDNFNSYPNVQLIDGPILDPEPEEASKKLILAGGLLASFFASVSLVLSLESASPLLSPKDLALLEIPVLFGIARLKQPDSNWDITGERQLKKIKSDQGNSPPLLNSSPLPYSPQAKKISLYKNDQARTDWREIDLKDREFERLATTFRSLELENRRVMITSAMAGEGKTTISLGLAIALGKLGFNVLVVDSDLQRSSLSRHFGVVPKQQEPEKIEMKQVIHFAYGLSLLPAPAVPKEEQARFFAKGQFEQHLDQVQAEGNYDYVLVDTPPVSLTSEAMLMTPIINNVLFVVRPGESDRPSVMLSLEQLKLHKAQIEGLILNEVNSSSSEYYYGYYPKPDSEFIDQNTLATYEPNLN